MVSQMHNQSNREWHIILDSVRGATHKRNGRPNQDAEYWSSTEKAVMLAISDGHGSDKYFRSDTGSKLAVEVAVKVLEEFISRVDIQSQDKESIKKQTTELPQIIVTKWREAVQAHLEKKPFFKKEDEKQFSNQSTLVAEVDKNPLIPYGATLLAVLVTKTFICCLQLGDGDITFVTANGKIVFPMEEDKRLLANETTSLCTRTAAEDFRRRFLHLKNEPPALIMLSTDGYANSFSTTRDFQQVGRDILQKLYEDNGPANVERQFKEWLQAATETGSGDDITAGIMCYLEIINKRPAPLIEPLLPEPVADVQPPQQTEDRPHSQPEVLVANRGNLPGGPVPRPRVPLDAPTERAPAPGQFKRPDNVTKDNQKVPSYSQPSSPPSRPIPEQPRGQYQQRENEASQPRQLRVSRQGKGDYTTIQQALDSIAPGGVIYVGPGIYLESLRIKKNVQLIAWGEKGKPVAIQSTMPCLVIQAQNVTVRGFEITGKRGGQDPQKEYCAIYVDAKKIEIIECNISSESDCGIQIDGEEAQVTLKRCKIRHMQSIGVRLMGKRSLLELEGCIIWKTGMGVSVENDAKARINGSHISNNTYGVYIRDGNLEINKCNFDNDYNIIIQKAKQVLLNDCTYSDSKRDI
jgi:serine/threonine protein phosphatase PrpC